MVSLDARLKAVDTYYFDEVVAWMSPVLRPLACDLRILRHAKESHRIRSTSEVLSRDYLLAVQRLDDIFPVSEEHTQILSNAYVLGLFSYMLLDNIADNQSANEPLSVLVQQHIAASERACYSGLFGVGHPFWSEYEANLRAIYDALALEVHCVSRFQAPYTDATMREVAAGKSAYYHTTCYALAMLSDKQDCLPVLRQVYEALHYADQLGDDASDWEEDFQEKRATFPVVRAAELMAIPVTAVLTLDQETIEDCLLQNGILPDMCERGITALQGASARLAEIGLENSKLNQLLCHRIQEERLRKRNFVAMTFLHGLAESLKVKP